MPSKRKFMQLYFALLFNANFKAFASGDELIYTGNSKKVCMPGLNCYSCPGAVTACPLGSLQGAINDTIAYGHSTLYYVGGILLLYCILFGRMICGWLCPFGLIQELLYKIKTPKLKKGPITRILSYLKYVILVFFVFIVPITYALRKMPLPAFCKYICPAGTLGGGISILAEKANAGTFSMLGPIFTWKFFLLISIVVGSIFAFRMFCRFLCPLGALYGLFNKISFFGVKVEESKCTHCNLCTGHCKMDVKVVGDQECISCGECISVCPTKAIDWKGTGIFRKGSEALGTEKHKTARLITRSISVILLVGILVGAIVYYWNEDRDTTPSQKPSTENNTDDVIVGNQIGNQCYNFDLTIVNGDGITTDTINPVDSGKITIINFWGTWCTPCVNELPYFEQIADEYVDEVQVIAIHSNMLHDTESAYLKENYPSSNIIFAHDGTNEDFYKLLGGTGTYPYTIVLDENGIITDIFQSSVEYEDLKEAVENNLTVVEEGNQVNQQCYGYDLTIVTGDGITKDTINPVQTGKITIINFWGTWCTPCVNELPYFEQIADEYGDTVQVIAIHSNMLHDTEAAYLKENYPASKIVFAHDDTNEDYYKLLGGTGTYPYTIVLNEHGIITDIFLSSVHYEDLKNAVEAQQN